VRVSRAGSHDFSSKCFGFSLSLFEIFSGTIEFSGVNFFIEVGASSKEFLIGFKLIPWFVKRPSAVGGWVEFGTFWEERVF